jgi:hypothetical protein
MIENDPIHNLEYATSVLPLSLYTLVVPHSTHFTTMEAPRISSRAVQEDSFADLDIERHDHDQLPNAEELKSSTLITNKRRRTLLLIGIVGIFVLLVILIPLSVHYSQTNAQSTETTTSSPRFQQTTAFLLEQDYVDHDALSTPGSPQRRAAEWMADEDELQLSLEGKSHAFLQRYALATIFYATQGDTAWAHQLKFLSGVQECGWNVDFIGDNNSTITMGVVCNNDNSVNELVIRK